MNLLANLLTRWTRPTHSKASHPLIQQNCAAQQLVDHGREKNNFLNSQHSPAAIANVGKLLDQAILRAAKERALIDKSSDKSPTLSPSKWIWQLAASYHLTHSTPQLMGEAAQKFSATNRQRLAEWAMEKAHEEQGHDRLVLLDIQAMGYDATAVVENLFPASAMALLNFFTQSVRTTDPIGCVGYCYTMERLAMSIKADHVQLVEAMLPPGIYATRCLRTHSSLGSDVKHAKETLEMIADLTPEEQFNISMACYKTASLYFDSLQDNPVSETELQQRLTQFKLRTELAILNEC